MIFLVFGGEPSAHVREHLHAPERDVPGVALALTVGILSLLAFAGGWIQFAPFWTPISDWLAPVAPPLVGATNWDEAISSIVGAAVGAAGILVAGVIDARGRVRVPSARPWRALLEHKFYFDEAYDRIFYRPADAAARLSARFFEDPIVDGSIAAVSEGTREAGREVTEIQTGVLRLYVLFIAVGVALLALLFVVVR
jgi:NADH-quinone oxidoreductase subunit L